MAQLGQLGDFSGDKVSNGFEPVPAGTYKAHVVESELNQTKDGTGQLIKATFEILDGPQAGKKIIVRYNIVNRNQTAQEIGRGQLKAFLTYSGHPNPNMLRDTNEMHGRPVLITVVVKPAQKDAHGNEQYGPSNEIKSYAGLAGAQAAKPAAAGAGFAAPKPPAAPAATAVAQPSAPAAVAPGAASSAAAADDIPDWDTATQPAANGADLKAAAGF